MKQRGAGSGLQALPARRFLAAAGAAYATIPDGNGVYTACPNTSRGGRPDPMPASDLSLPTNEQEAL